MIDRGMMEYERLIEGYEILQRKCYKAAMKDNGRLMGEDAWLRHALQEFEIRMMFTPGGINCYGSTYTTQTVSEESFSFVIPMSELEN